MARVKFQILEEIKFSTDATTALLNLAENTIPAEFRRVLCVLKLLPAGHRNFPTRFCFLISN
jgi:hypothetical protein